MILMLWLYLTGIVLILGFELNLILMKCKHKDFVCKQKPWYVKAIDGETAHTHKKRRRKIRRKRK